MTQPSTRTWSRLLDPRRRDVVDVDRWVDGGRDFGERFVMAAGHSEAMAAEAGCRKRKWIAGMAGANAAFG